MADENAGKGYFRMVAPFPNRKQPSDLPKLLRQEAIADKEAWRPKWPMPLPAEPCPEPPSRLPIDDDEPVGTNAHSLLDGIAAKLLSTPSPIETVRIVDWDAVEGRE